jgi:hypothetical protein
MILVVLLYAALVSAIELDGTGQPVYRPTSRSVPASQPTAIK